jgi:hypothetical protein
MPRRCCAPESPQMPRRSCVLTVGQFHRFDKTVGHCFSSRCRLLCIRPKGKRALQETEY